MVGSTSGVLPSTPLLPFWLPMITHSQTLIENMLSQELGPDSIVAALSSFTSRPDWLCLEDIGEPLHQRLLSAAFDEALSQHFFSTAPSICARALALLSALPHAGDWINGIPSTTMGLHLQDKEFTPAHTIASTQLLLLLP